MNVIGQICDDQSNPSCQEWRRLVVLGIKLLLLTISQKLMLKILKRNLKPNPTFYFETKF